MNILIIFKKRFVKNLMRNLIDGVYKKCCQYCISCYVPIGGGSSICRSRADCYKVNAHGCNCYNCPENCADGVKDSNNNIYCTECKPSFGLNDEQKSEPC